MCTVRRLPLIPATAPGPAIPVTGEPSQREASRGGCMLETVFNVHAGRTLAGLTRPRGEGALRRLSNPGFPAVLVMRAVSTPLRQPDSEFTVATPST
jgi:hypothetical protein